MKPWTKNQLRRIRIAMMLNSDARNRYIKKKQIFKSMGENVFFQPRVIPSDPQLIKFHNNIVITSNVTFVTHDVFHMGLNQLGKGEFPYSASCIEIMDNVFIGCNTTILGNVKIGPNVVIGAGSVITKDVEPNSVVVGNPAKKIGTFDEYLSKRKELFCSNDEKELWENFERQHK
ncbi:MAG: acyltransferase [Bacilli bacterium]|nr:acyltransferase [Bacilli bacterium]MBR1817912.1 acyltransferase [Bacilli bacterium]